MQHPANPILDTLEEVPGYPKKLKIYQIPASRYWYMRTWMGGKMVVRSTKTDEKAKARKAAKEFYNELLDKHAKKLPLTEGSTFKKAADALLEEDRARVARGERKESLVRDGGYLLKHLKEFFKNDHVKNIDFTRINAYVEHLRTKGKKPPSSATVKNHLIFLSKVLKHATKLNLMDKMPIFPTVSRVDNPRGWFDKEQYKLLLKTCTECEGHIPGKKVHHSITKELRMVCAFLVNSFLRPPDLKNLRNRDIAVIKNRGIKYLRISAKSKVKKSPVVTMPLAVDVYEKLTEFNKALGFGKLEDFVFFPALSKHRGYALQTMRLQFNYVLEKAGLKMSDDGQPRTLYSLRHTAIMLSLIDGSELDLFTLAQNCRTSVDMIQRFYGKHLHAEMNITKLHKRKPSGNVAEIIHKINEDGEYWALVQNDDDSHLA